MSDFDSDERYAMRAGDEPAASEAAAKLKYGQRPWTAEAMSVIDANGNVICRAPQPLPENWPEHAKLLAAAPDVPESYRKVVEALKPFAAFYEKAEAFVDARAKDGGSPIMPCNDFRLSDFRRVAEAVQEAEALATLSLPGGGEGEPTPDAGQWRTLAAAVFNQCCPGIRVTEADLDFYEKKLRETFDGDYPTPSPAPPPRGVCDTEEVRQLIEKLDGLDAKRTEGPWEVSDYKAVRGQTATIQSRDANRFSHIATVFPEAARFKEGEELAFEEIGFFDAHFIVELANAWPRLRAVLTQAGWPGEEEIARLIKQHLAASGGSEKILVHSLVPALRAVLNLLPGAPAGWKLVPGEPTEEMLRAALAEFFDSALAQGQFMDDALAHIKNGSVSEAYRAMLAAAPTPSPQGGEK